MWDWRNEALYKNKALLEAYMIPPLNEIDLAKIRIIKLPLVNRLISWYARKWISSKIPEHAEMPLRSQPQRSQIDIFQAFGQV